MRKYYKYKIQNLIKIKNIVTIEYYELFPNYHYPYESHVFWEIVYVDNGKIICNFENQKLTLFQGEMLLINPNKMHSYEVSDIDAPSIIYICFESDSNILNSVTSKMTLNIKNLELISDIMRETNNTFVMPFKEKLRLLKNPNPGGQQLVQIYLEQLLILLLRENMTKLNDVKFFMSNIELENHVAKDIINILKNNIYNNIEMNYICCKTNYSKTYINNIFKKHIGDTVINYYKILKITEAKKLIRQNKHNITEISNMLQFDNPNYFSKVFKKYTNLTPSQYNKSIRKELEN